MKISTFILSFFSFLFILFFNGCLKDKITPPVEVSLSDGGKMLFYLEDKGDYINSDEMPSLADVDEVFSHLNTYLLLDIRSAAEFGYGHVDGAFNVLHTKLVSFLDSVDYLRYSKVIIISNNGQSSAYYTCLLRLYGFSNVYSMNYGMAAWNTVFSNEWFEALQQNYEFLSEYYTDTIFEKPPFTPLPDVILSGSSIEESVRQRINEMMSIDYEDKLGYFESTATIVYYTLMGALENFFMVCYNEGLLYKDIRSGISHPVGTVLFHPPPPSSSSLRSTTDLQSLPSNMKIAVYSTNGQLGAFAVAYLRVLGYDAKSILFGANNMFYYQLLESESLNEDAFSELKIRDYPFVTGN